MINFIRTIQCEAARGKKTRNGINGLKGIKKCTKWGKNTVRKNKSEETRIPRLKLVAVSWMPTVSLAHSL